MQKQEIDHDNMKLDQKGQLIELTAILIAVTLLAGCMLKVVFL